MSKSARGEDACRAQDDSLWATTARSSATAVGGDPLRQRSHEQAHFVRMCVHLFVAVVGSGVSRAAVLL